MDSRKHKLAGKKFRERQNHYMEMEISLSGVKETTKKILECITDLILVAKHECSFVTRKHRLCA